MATDNGASQSPPVPAPPPEPTGPTDPAPAPTPPAPEQPGKDLSRNLALLAKGEAKLRAERKAFDEARKKHEEERSSWSREQEELRTLIQQDALEGIRRWAKKHGIEGDPYDAMTRAALRKPKQGTDEPAAVTQLRAEIESMKKAAAEREQAEKKRIEEETTRAQQASIEAYKRSIHDHIHAKEHLEKYEVLIASQAEADVFNLIQRQYQIDFADKGDAATPLSIDEAANIIEEKLTERLRKLAALKKLAPGNSGTEASQSQEAPKETPAGTRESSDGPKTLTNAQAAQVVSRSSSAPRLGADKRREEQERFERALKKLG